MDDTQPPIGWGRATGLALAILAIGAACFVFVPNWVLTNLTGLSNNARIAVATVGFFAILVGGAWLLRRLQARGVI